MVYLSYIRVVVYTYIYIYIGLSYINLYTDKIVIKYTGMQVSRYLGGLPHSPHTGTKLFHSLVPLVLSNSGLLALSHELVSIYSR